MWEKKDIVIKHRVRESQNFATKRFLYSFYITYSTSPTLKKSDTGPEVVRNYSDRETVAVCHLNASIFYRDKIIRQIPLGTFALKSLTN